MDVAGRHARDAEPLGEALQPQVARPIMAPERPLQLDPEAVGPEGARQPASQRLGGLGLASGRAAARALEHPRERPLPRAPGQADQPLGTPLERGQRQGGGEGLATRLRARPGVSLGDQPAQIPPSILALDQKREMKTRRQRSRRRACRRIDGQLGPDDGADAERLARLRELHRSPDPVVVGQSKRLVAVLCRPRRKLLRRRRPVEEGVGGVTMELDVAHDLCSNQRPASAGSQKTTTLRPSASTSSK